jgi:hypothetical protein
MLGLAGSKVEKSGARQIKTRPFPVYMATKKTKSNSLSMLWLKLRLSFGIMGVLRWLMLSN